MSESPQMSPTPSPPPTMPPEPAPKRYRPPQPDTNTFETQEEFLASLEPVPIETVDADHRRCPHCWKYYGESDPDLDNAEVPVRLRCNHVLGDKCLQDLFGLPQPVRVNFKELSYEPGSKGADLGRRLSAWVDHCGVDKGALLLGGNRDKDFTKLLNEFQTHPAAEKALGTEWCSVLAQALMPRRDVEAVHILENAVIFDVVSKVASPETKSAKASATSSTTIPAPAGQTLTAEHWILTPGVAPHVVTPPTNYAEDAAYSESASTCEATSEAEVALTHWAHTLYDKPIEHESSNTSNAVSDKPTEHNSSNATKPGWLQAELTKTGSGTASDADSETSSPGNGNSIVPATVDNAEKKKKSQIYKENELLAKMAAQESKLKKSLEQLDDPSLLPYLPNHIHLSMSGFAVSQVPLPFSTASSQPIASTDMLPKASELFLDMLFEKDAKSTPKTPAPKEAAPGTWKDNMPKTSNLDKLVALQKKQKAVEKALEAAYNKKEAQIAYQKEAQKRAVKLREERNALQKQITRHFIDAFREIYEDYERFKYNEAVASGQPPPIKKLRLATNSASPISSPEPAPAPTNPRIATVVHVAATVHQRDLGAKGYEVPPPHMYASGMPGESDSEDEDDGDLDFRTYFVTRTRCQPTCAQCPDRLQDGGFGGRGRGRGLPEFITWTDSKSVRDSCIICKKILFRKPSPGPFREGF